MQQNGRGNPGLFGCVSGKKYTYDYGNWCQALNLLKKSKARRSYEYYQRKDPLFIIVKKPTVMALCLVQQRVIVLNKNVVFFSKKEQDELVRDN
ncbi:hypothetical protein DGG96_09415 [Legionella qingyii]|uniref:Uncharacterized protein n=1 Tax=Legionella qingyii TaxID=2184757 RepID=A0A317U1M6_9GAMM|nr:hypothetical protein DGG96_09415 [Legionella qingyii]